MKSVKLPRDYKKKENILNPVVNLSRWNYSIEVINNKVKAHTTSPTLVFPKEIYCYFTITIFSHVN